MNEIQNGPRPIDDRSPPGDDTVALLLEVAGHRPDAPQVDAAIVKAAAHEEWQRAVWANHRKKVFYRGAGTLLAAAASLLLVLGTGLGARLWQSFGDPVARVVQAAGGDGEIVAGSQLRAGDVVTTAGPAGASSAAPTRVALTMSSGAAVRLDAGTLVRLKSDSILELERGAVHVDSQGSTLEIHTAFGVVTNIGTRYKVELLPGAAQVEVKVHEGQVRWEDRDGRFQIALAGQQLMASGDAVSSPLPIPPFQSEGRTVREVLDWAAGEGGWVLEFTSAELESEVSDPELVLESRTPVGPGLEDAIAQALLLAGGRLGYRIEGVILTIRRG